LKQSSDSSKAHLAFHTEIVFHPFAPDFLILLCLWQDPDKKAETLVSSISNVLESNLLSQTNIDLLRKPIYRAGIDYSFGNIATTKGNGPTMACLYGDNHDQLLSFDLDLMLGLTVETNSALLKLKEALQTVSVGIKLERVDLIVIDNRRVIHGRTPFIAYFDGSDRWLQRCLVSRND
jgi:L-asparagine oxygenase